jgi:hypothetical protein
MVPVPPRQRTRGLRYGDAMASRTFGARAEQWWTSRRQALAAHAREALAAQVRVVLAPRQALHGAARADADALRPAVHALAARADALYARLDRTPFSGALTVHAAHARHPGVQAVFARHGLPRCPDCAVGADETLAEAAFGEGLPLDTLLAELNALSAVFR